MPPHELRNRGTTYRLHSPYEQFAQTNKQGNDSSHATCEIQLTEIFDIKSGKTSGNDVKNIDYGASGYTPIIGGSGRTRLPI
jgi:hypothetical protein